MRRRAVQPLVRRRLLDDAVDEFAGQRQCRDRRLKFHESLHVHLPEAAVYRLAISARPRQTVTTASKYTGIGKRNFQVSTPIAIDATKNVQTKTCA